MNEENNASSVASAKEENTTEIENLKLEIENLRKQSDEYLNGWKRAKADYLNLKKEMEAQNNEIKAWMSKVFILPLLGIMDSFDKAFGSIPENIMKENWVEGIGGIRKQFEDFLAAQGIETVKAAGEKFDPLEHEAVESVEGGEAGTIAEELQKGYSIKGEILRPAKVKVYK
ncbi:nucleotide exchange factor GrpE [Candidatus Azambacteria bacterium]|nr:nucleotide exchange factor GrpE [Candidatus Azambacteria bacterium]